MIPALQHGLAFGWQLLLFAGGMLFGACLASRRSRRERVRIYRDLVPLFEAAMQGNDASARLVRARAREGAV